MYQLGHQVMFYITYPFDVVAGALYSISVYIVVNTSVNVSVGLIYYEVYGVVVGQV